MCLSFEVASSSSSHSSTIVCLPEPRWPLHRTTTPTSSNTSSSVSHQHSRVLAKLQDKHFLAFVNVLTCFSLGFILSKHEFLFCLWKRTPFSSCFPTGAYSTSVTGISIKPQPPGCLSSSVAAQTALKSPGAFILLFASRLARLEMLHIVAWCPGGERGGCCCIMHGATLQA